ncbi:Kinesin-associated protein 3 [Rhizophlyctis rosea]|nr:Kinesin-associated protein 3 [Rhizophlyctis rosea]
MEEEGRGNGGGEGGGVSDRAQLRRQLDEQYRQFGIGSDEDRDVGAGGGSVLRKGRVGVQETPPTLADLDKYIEGLYEEIPDKIASTRNILQLARNPENMDALISNDSLLSALSRVLREENRKSIDLVTNIIYIFFCFSNFSEYHPAITQNKVGDMCLRVADQEVRRFEIWCADLGRVETKCAQNPRDTALLAELDQEHRKFQAMLRKQDQLLFVAFHLLLNLAEDLSIEVKMLKRDIIKYLVALLDRKTPELLILVVTFLKKLSVFKENKDEMIKISDTLLPKLDALTPTDHQGLQNLTLRLLLNLSHDEKFRTILVRMGFLGKLVALLNNKAHLVVTLQLLYMLSIDERSKSAFAFMDLIPLLMKMILDPKPYESVYVELMALAINVAAHSRNAEVMCEENGLRFLVKRAVKTRDPLMFKVLRNLSMWDGVKMGFLVSMSDGTLLARMMLESKKSEAGAGGQHHCANGYQPQHHLPQQEHIDALCNLLLKPSTPPDLQPELLGILSNLTILNFDWAKLANAYGLFDFISTKLKYAIAAVGDGGGAKMEGSGIMEDDDVTLEIVILVGTMAGDEGIAEMAVRSRVLEGLMDLMIAKEEDDEIILQIIYCIYQFLLQEPARIHLITKTQVVSYLIDLLYDRNVEIRRMCDVCLDIIAEIDEEWVKSIRLQKFQWHNSEWLALITQASQLPGNGHAFEEETTLFSKHKLVGEGMRRRGAVTGYAESEEEEETDSEGDEDDGFGRRLVVGGNSAILDGP